MSGRSFPSGFGGDVQAQNISVLRQSFFFHRMKNSTAALRLENCMPELSGIGQGFFHFHGKCGEVFGQIEFRQSFHFKGEAVFVLPGVLLSGEKSDRRKRQNSGLLQNLGNAVVHEPFHGCRPDIVFFKVGFGCHVHDGAACSTPAFFIYSYAKTAESGGGTFHKVLHDPSPGKQTGRFSGGEDTPRPEVRQWFRRPWPWLSGDTSWS